MKKKYRLTIAMLLAGMLAGNQVMAQEPSEGSGEGAGEGTEQGTGEGTGQSSGTGVRVYGNVYGGGNLGDVGTHNDKTPASVGNYDWTENTGQSKVVMTSDDAVVQGNVYGGGKGEALTFECEKGMVFQTSVEISNGTVEGNVYGGGEVSRVEGNTVVTIGADGTEPKIEGSVFGAGAGIETHGYSALVRGTSSVTIQGKAHVWHNVYGGGELASVGKYKVKTPANEGDDDVPSTLPYGMPAKLIDGGTSTVNIQGSAKIGTDNDANTGHVYGAGQGLNPSDKNYDFVSADNYTGEGEYNMDDHKPKRMISGGAWEYFSTEAAYLQFVETLALSGETYVTIGGKRNESTGDITPLGNPNVKGSVFGGSESGFVYKNSFVNIKNGTVNGDAFGGGRGLASFAEAGRVRWNTNLAVSGGTVEGNVYGGGNLGDVGTINKSDQTNHNYIWKNSDTNGNVNAEGNDNGANNNNETTATEKNTGICTVTISGGTIGIDGIDNPDDKTKHGNVFGAGRGYKHTWWCEKAIAYATKVSISEASGSTTMVYGNVYGGGEIGRVEDDSKVIIGTANGSDTPDIKGSVFGAGKGLATRGYSALVRGNSVVTIQGSAQVGGSVFGGGEEASLGRFNLVGGLPKSPASGGSSTVTIQDNANVGPSGTEILTHHVYGAGQGVTPNYDTTQSYKNYKSMQLYANKPKTGNAGDTWDYYVDDGIEDRRFVWVYYKTESEYLAFLNTLALASHPTVTIAENATVYGDIYGGGQRGITLGDVAVNITGGTVKQDVYGGGSLADTNKGNWETTTDTWAEGKYNTSTHVTTYKTNVSLKGGVIDRDVYGGGLGQLKKDAIGNPDEDGYVPGVSAVEAMVYGDVMVKLNEPTTSEGTTTYGTCVVKGNIFGCNNVNGTPKGNVTVHVYKTQGWTDDNGTPNDDSDDISHDQTTAKSTNAERTGTKYELAAVYGGGNNAAFVPADTYNGTAYNTDDGTTTTNVIIDGCDLTSIEYVYGGGNAAPAPGTLVTINSCYEIGTLFAGGNGAGDDNPGANVGYLTDGTTAYGSGEALAVLHGGTIHKAFGGSNTLGNVRTSATVTLDEATDQNGAVICPLSVDEVYGAGNEADQDGTSNINLGCLEYLGEIYGGAKNADVNSDIVLTIQSGRFDRVFGGNNLGGKISGTITVNIEETGCHPIVIGQLFGGGNQAAYSVENIDKNRLDLNFTNNAATNYYKDFPKVNVKSFTSIGEIYGGGYGSTAILTGNPHVNINECVGEHAEENINTDLKDQNGVYVLDDNNQRIKVSDNTGKWIHFGVDPNDPTHITTVWQPEHKSGEIGTIGNVFGGGNEAPVHGDTNVNIGLKEYVEITTGIIAGTTDVNGYYTYTNGVYTPIESSTLAAENTTYYKKVIGVNITGNVYGGGNAADVTGDTNVVIGQ